MPGVREAASEASKCIRNHQPRCRDERERAGLVSQGGRVLDLNQMDVKQSLGVKRLGRNYALMFLCSIHIQFMSTTFYFFVSKKLPGAVQSME